jgi:hypothetical protein
MRLTQADVSACRDAYLAHDSDAARLRAMLAAAHQDAPDDVVLDLCSQVALQRPLLAVHETAQPTGGPGAAGGSGESASGAASFEMLLRVVEQQARSADDAEEDSLLSFIALGGGADKTGFVSSDRMKAVCKVRAVGGRARAPDAPYARSRARRLRGLTWGRAPCVAPRARSQRHRGVRRATQHRQLRAARRKMQRLGVGLTLHARYGAGLWAAGGH